MPYSTTYEKVRNLYGSLDLKCRYVVKKTNKQSLKIQIQRSQVCFFICVKRKTVSTSSCEQNCFWWWPADLQSCKKSTDRKNLTFDLNHLSLQWRSHQIYTWIVKGLRVLSCEVVYSMGSCWRNDLRGLKDCTRVLFVISSGQCNRTCQWDPVLFSTFVMYPTGGFKICFHLLGMRLVHIFTFLWKVLNHFNMIFYLKFPFF